MQKQFKARNSSGTDNNFGFEQVSLLSRSSGLFSDVALGWSYLSGLFSDLRVSCGEYLSAYLSRVLDEYPNHLCMSRYLSLSYPFAVTIKC